MDEKQIAFIICADNAQFYNECVWYIDRLEVPEGYSIDILCIQEAESMAEGYNAGRKASDAKYKVYLQQDTFILNRNFIKDMLAVFETDTSIGMIGLRGVDFLPSDTESNFVWNLGGITLYNGRSTEGYFHEGVQKGKFTYAQAIDGFLMATQYDVAFREDVGDDWDSYPITHSQEMQRAGYKIAVPYQQAPWCYQDQGIKEFSPEWKAIQEKLVSFMNAGEYEGLIPIMWEMQEIWPADTVIREIINVMEIYFWEKESTSGIHSEFFDGRSWEEIYEYYKWTSFVLRRIACGYEDEETELLKEKVLNKLISLTVVQKIADIYLTDSVKVYEYLLEAKDEPPVSVIVPVYNGEAFVKRTIDSILNQTYRNLEVIIIDDASKDNSKKIISSYRDARIKAVFQKENNNVCYSGNVGFGLAQGKYVALIGHDDVWKSDKLQKQVAFMEEHPSCSVCFTWADIIDEDEVKVNERYNLLYQRFCSNNRSREQWIKKMLLGGNHFCAPSACIRKNVLEKVGYYRYGLLQLQDYELWLRILKEGPCYILKNKLVQYRRFTEAGHNLSESSPDVRNRDVHELQWIFDTYVWGMPKEEFVNVFRTKLKDPQVENEKEVLCEKAFLIWEGRNCFAEKHFIELLEDDECRDIFERKYQFRLQDFYKMNARPMLFDTEMLYKVRELEAVLAEYQKGNK